MANMLTLNGLEESLLSKNSAQNVPRRSLKSQDLLHLLLEGMLFPL